MSKIKFNCTPAELNEVEMIIERYSQKAPCDKFSLLMDIVATHCNGNPLKLSELKTARDYDFFHDVCGIMKNVDRKTGKLQNFFSPRYSA